jgi:hypothetical protein
LASFILQRPEKVGDLAREIIRYHSAVASTEMLVGVLGTSYLVLFGSQKS